MLQLKESRHAKWKVEVQNAANIICKILQIPCNMKGSIFHMANTHTNSVVCFFCLFGFIVRQFSFFLVLQSSTGGLLDFTNSNHNSNSNTNGNNKKQK
jgi:hypothetical protein